MTQPVSHVHKKPWLPDPLHISGFFDSLETMDTLQDLLEALTKMRLMEKEKAKMDTEGTETEAAGKEKMDDTQDQESTKTPPETLKKLVEALEARWRTYSTTQNQDTDDRQTQRPPQLSVPSGKPSTSVERPPSNSPAPSTKPSIPKTTQIKRLAHSEIEDEPFAVVSRRTQKQLARKAAIEKRLEEEGLEGWDVL